MRDPLADDVERADARLVEGAIGYDRFSEHGVGVNEPLCQRGILEHGLQVVHFGDRVEAEGPGAGDKCGEGQGREVGEERLQDKVQASHNISEITRLLEQSSCRLAIETARKGIHGGIPLWHSSSEHSAIEPVGVLACVIDGLEGLDEQNRVLIGDSPLLGHHSGDRNALESQLAEEHGVLQGEAQVIELRECCDVKAGERLRRGGL
jgi:hypothetical protein